MGVGTGLVGAYVLAGELAAAGGDHRVALPAYEARMRRCAGRWQKGANPGQFLAPSTATRLRLRNVMLRRSAVRRLLLAGTASVAAPGGLPAYDG
ncbi:hypothetical protein [Streptomyces fuscigenes]|uniref:hypothetical protein n=1 Tax=Streptomyces fuscigenes TaxID=1528880 RepID=UPI001F351A4B|nr:hypothetical protein [Streptomyces fuscigenes]MCF3961812.1 hypothetical protein [Streptomyces fuscigenes]